MKWRNKKYFSTWQSRDWETNKPGMSYINENSFSRWIIQNANGITTLGLQNNNRKRSHTQLDSRKQVIAFQDRVITINIKEALIPMRKKRLLWYWE